MSAEPITPASTENNAAVNTPVKVSTPTTLASEQPATSVTTLAVQSTTPETNDPHIATPVKEVVSTDVDADGEEAIPDDLSEISDDADEILNRQEVDDFLFLSIF